MVEPWKLTKASFLSPDEVALLLERVRDRDQAGEDRPVFLADRLIIEGLLFSGLRNSEFCSLQLGGTAAARKESVFVVEETPKQDRTVHVPDFVSELVRRYARDVRPGLLRAGADPKDPSIPLLVNERGRPYERTGLYRRVLRILSDAGFGARASVQLLRHTYGYLAYKESGGNLLFVQRQLGHAHPMVTAVYAEFVTFPPDQLANTTAAPFEPRAASRRPTSGSPSPAEASEPRKRKSRKSS